MRTIPPNCPFCKSEPTYVSERSGTYACHTSIHIVYDDTHISQPTECIRRERGRLAARIEELEGELESHAWKISPAMAQAKIDQLNEKVKRLEDWCERMADMLQEDGWESTAQNEFNKYKENKS